MAAAPQWTYTPPPKRPGFGKAGKSIKVYANHFQAGIKLAEGILVRCSACSALSRASAPQGVPSPQIAAPPGVEPLLAWQPAACTHRIFPRFRHRMLVPLASCAGASFRNVAQPLPAPGPAHHICM